MSYSIVMDRKFIRTSTGIIPMVLMGDSSLRTNAGEVVRNWTVLDQDLINVPFSKAQENITQKETQYRDKDAFFWRGKSLPMTKLYAWFKKGCDDARTLEEYLIANPKQKYLSCAVTYHSKGKGWNTTNLKCCRTDQELESWLASALPEAEALRSLMKCSDAELDDVFLSLEFSEKTPLLATPECGTAVIAKHGTVYVKSYVTGKELTFTSIIDEAAVFKNLETAHAELGDCWDLRFVKAPKHGTRDFVLKIVTVFDEEFFILKTRAGQIFRTKVPKEAKRFDTQQKATTYAERLWQLGWTWKNIQCFSLVTGESWVVKEK